MAIQALNRADTAAQTEAEKAAAAAKTNAPAGAGKGESTVKKADNAAKKAETTTDLSFGQKVGDALCKIWIIGGLIEKILGLCGFKKTEVAVAQPEAPKAKTVEDLKKEITEATTKKEDAQKALSKLLQKEGKEDAGLKSFSDAVSTAVRAMPSEDRNVDKITLSNMKDFEKIDEKKRKEIFDACVVLVAAEEAETAAKEAVTKAGEAAQPPVKTDKERKLEAATAARDKADKELAEALGEAAVHKSVIVAATNKLEASKRAHNHDEMKAILVANEKKVAEGDYEKVVCALNNFIAAQAEVVAAQAEVQTEKDAAEAEKKTAENGKKQ